LKERDSINKIYTMCTPNNLQASRLAQNSQPAYHQKGNKFLKPAKLDSLQNKLRLISYDFSSINN
jgi:hypothetical protein